MAKKEVVTDYWVRDLLKEANIELEPQGSTIIEIDNALKSASKKGTGNVGFPEFVGVIKDFLLVIENKADLSKHIKMNNDGQISLVSNKNGSYEAHHPALLRKRVRRRRFKKSP